MFCYKCGEKNQDIASFCKKCGIRMVALDSVSTTKQTSEGWGILSKILGFFSAIFSYLAQIAISATISLAVLYGLFLAWAKYGSHH